MARSHPRLRRVTPGRSFLLPVGYFAVRNLEDWVSEHVSGCLDPEDVIAIADRLRADHIATRWQGQWLVSSRRLPDPLETLLP